MDNIITWLHETWGGEFCYTLMFSMLPIVELRGGIPLGVGMGLPLPLAVTAAVIGNMLPVPFIILFIRRIYLWLQRRIPPLRGLLERLERRVEAKKDLVLRYEFWGLLLLVAVPLPGTGAWTGAMVAAVMDLRIKRAVPAIFGGVLLAAAVVTAITMGLFSL
ncbi:MAG: small multi-drug export protein [Oscillospiraceae bacterium]|nr:small multi-drug export protein [Oscillospiraceae bacterium]